jgi:hypothetical protein
MRFLWDLVTTIGIELVPHLLHPQGKRPPQYQWIGGSCNNAPFHQEIDTTDEGVQILQISLGNTGRHRSRPHDPQATI